jgi:hypothetical protein
MKQLKISKTVFNTIITDLQRPHKFAYERVGFLYVKTGSIENQIQQILATTYVPIPDDNYIMDSKVGAKINSTAIRNVMQRILTTGEGALHVHMHDNVGVPRFSRVDRESLVTLIPSFQSCNTKTAHGALLLSRNLSTALVWLPNKKEPIFVDNITIVGYPLELGGRY